MSRGRPIYPVTVCYLFSDESPIDGPAGPLMRCEDHVQPIWFWSAARKRWEKEAPLDSDGQWLSYMKWHERAAASNAKRIYQTRCPDCFRFFFPWERFA